MGTKEAFHKLIDKIEDEEILKGYFILIQNLNSQKETELWNSLSTAEKEELVISYEESFHQENLMSHDQVRKQHDKWLGK